MKKTTEDQLSSLEPKMGASIRDRRQRLGLTLRAMSASCGLSVPFLSQIERDQAAPSVLSLIAIARALGVDISYFVKVPRPGQIVRRAATPDLIELGSPVTYSRLSGHHQERKLEALHIAVPAGLSAPMTRREGEGFWYVLSGKLEVHIGEERFVLQAGDSAHFDQRHPYRMRNQGKDEVRMIWVGTPALFSD